MSSKLLDQLRAKIRQKHYSIRTEEAYVQWCKRFILFHNKRHPSEMGVPEVEQYLTHLVEAGYDIRTIQELLGHKDVSTTIVYLHVAQKNVLSVRSPLADL